MGLIILMDTPKYIKNLEKNGEVYSTATLVTSIEFDEFITKRKVMLVHSHSEIEENGKKNYQEKIYKTAQGFYIYIFNEGESTFKVTFYYFQNQSNEFDLFIIQLLKQFKNK
jgi:hypothetical protein